VPIRISAIALLGLGALLCAISLNLDRYSDPSWQEPFLVDIRDLDRDLLSERWHAARTEALTYRGTVENVGLGFILLGVSALGLATAFGTSTSRGHTQLVTPTTFLQWFAVALTAAVPLTGGFVSDLFVGFARGEFPWWADSLGIPLMAVTPLLTGGAVASGLFALAMFRVSPPPQPLSLSGAPTWLAVPLAALLLPVAALVALAVVQAPTYVPAFVVVLYLGASVRQAVLVRARDLTRHWS
jgi:hypothetical protein